VDSASNLLDASRTEFATAVSAEALQTLDHHLSLYRHLITTLREQDEDVARWHVENDLRECGQALVSFSEDMARRERETVHKMIRFTRVIPLGFLLCIVILSLYSAVFLTRHIIQRLARLSTACRRIGHGDLSPVLPTRKYRDEFTNVAIALNHMARELNRRQEFLVQSHKLRAVGTLTAGVAHELNNPINNIVLTAAMLQEDYDTLPDPERVEMIDDMVEQSERASKIVRNLLDFARESEMGLEQLRVQDIVADSLALASNQLKLHKVKVASDLPGNLPPINGDKQYLNQVFLNLILNATEAMPDGGSLNFTAEHRSETGFVAVHVTDTGTGIPTHILKSIFDPFFTTRPTGKGTGLGLSVSLGIIQKHGGDITVASEVGMGTTFTVLLPALNVPAPLGAKG
jgi:signal transduction histidine kinase